MPVPNIFGSATSAIPLSQLDQNFATAITLGNTAVYLGNTTTSLGNVTLTNVTISSGNVSVSTATVGAGSNTAPSITTTGDTNTGIFFPAADTIAFSEGGTEAMRLDSAGNMGLGVTPSAWASPFANGVFEFSGGFLAPSVANQTFRLGQNHYYNGSSYIYKANGPASAYIQNSGAHAWLNAASGTAGNTISFTQAMTLDASGNLGTNGQTSPGTFQNAGITVGTGNTNYGVNIYSSSTANGDVCFAKAASGVGLYNGMIRYSHTSDFMSFWTASTERARITSGGSLLVAKTTTNDGDTGFMFEPIRDGAGNGRLTITQSATTNSGVSFSAYSSGAAAYRFYVGMGGTIFATSTTISAISDIRYKENVRDLNVGLAEVMALKPRLYDWKEGKGADIKNARGFIAQEFEEVFPDLIDEWKDPAPEGEDPYKSVRADLIPVLVKAIQEQQAIIQTLTDRITALEAK
jgi:hypothetical protein